MSDNDRMAAQFGESRPHLRALAYRMLGSVSEADDAVQEAWLRYHRTDTSQVENLGGWLTTVVSRVCLDMLRSHASRREDPMDDQAPESVTGQMDGTDPEHEALMAESVGMAVMVVLETLAPAERLAFVLHDMFTVPFDEIAPIVERSPAATRKLASRARRRVQTASADTTAVHDRQQTVVDAFLAASRIGDLQSLVALLDPDAVVRADRVALKMGGEWEAVGAAAVAKVFSGRASAAKPVLIDGVPGAVWAPGGTPRVLIDFTIKEGQIVAIDLIADPTHIQEIELEHRNDEAEWRGHAR